MKYTSPWQEQFARVNRLRKDVQRFENSADNQFEQGVDAFTSFFIQCYHLSDWLVKSGYSANSVYEFVKQSTWLSLCRALANTQKHQKDSKGTFIDFGDFSFGVSTPIARYVDHLKKQTRFCINAREFGALPLDAMEFADKCINEWEKYLQIHTI